MITRLQPEQPGSMELFADRDTGIRFYTVCFNAAVYQPVTPVEREKLRAHLQKLHDLMAEIETHLDDLDAEDADRADREAADYAAQVRDDYVAAQVGR